MALFFGPSGSPQALVQYEGLLPYTTSASMTLTPGVSPSVCQLTLNSLPFVPPSNGTLIFGYGYYQWEFPNCKLDQFSVTSNGSKGQVVSVTIHDRRWMWADRGRVSGQYNTRINERIQAGTEKNPKELVSKCLDELGEVGYDISRVPVDLRPEVDWDYDRPANALSSLLEEIGCVCCLGPVDNRIYIIPKQFSNTVIDTTDVSAYDTQLDPPDPPADLRIVTQRIRYQADFLLEPVMMDFDGIWYSADQVSYAPSAIDADIPKWAASDWMGEQLLLDIDDDRERKIARRYLFRAYRVIPNKIASWEEPYDIIEDAKLPGLDEVITSWRDIEVLDSMSEVKNEDPDQQGADYLLNAQKPAIVWGTHYAANSHWRKNKETFNPALVFDEPAIVGSDKQFQDPNGMYEGGFSVDSDMAIVFFNEPMCEYKNYTVGDESYDLFVPCERLFIRTSVYARIEDVWQRYEYSSIPQQYSLPAPNWAVRYELKEDLEPYYHIDKDNPTGPPIENITTAVGPGSSRSIEFMAATYWNEISQEYQPKDALSATKIGWIPYGNDGAIRQVTWSVNEDGKAFTRISRNREEFHLSIGFEERRQLEARRKDRWKSERSEASRKREARKSKPKKPSA